MATIWCPRCSRHSNVKSWEEATREYGEENDIDGGYGNFNGILICPKCNSEIRANKLEVEND